MAVEFCNAQGGWGGKQYTNEAPPITDAPQTSEEVLCIMLKLNAAGKELSQEIKQSLNSINLPSTHVLIFGMYDLEILFKPCYLTVQCL